MLVGVYAFWRSKIDTRRDPASLWRTINEGLGRGGDGASHPATGLSAEAFADFFDQKVSCVAPSLSTGAAAIGIHVDLDNSIASSS